MVTEADWNAWTEKDLQPFINTVLECFGADRLMFGSDWPVAVAACSYKKWIEVAERSTASLSASERERVFGGTAREAYGCSRANKEHRSRGLFLTEPSKSYSGA
jgi:L-fuconolactonase